MTNWLGLISSGLMKRTAHFSFFFYATGKENKNKHSHKRLYSSFYHFIRDWSSDSLRFVSCSDHQNKCLVKLYFVQRGNGSITFLVCTAWHPGQSICAWFQIIFACKITQLCSHNLLLIPLWYGATVESPIRSTIKKRKNVLSFCLYKVLSYEKRASHLRFVWSQATQAQAQAMSH